MDAKRGSMDANRGSMDANRGSVNGNAVTLNLSNCSSIPSQTMTGTLNANGTATFDYASGVGSPSCPMACRQRKVSPFTPHPRSRLSMPEST